MVLTDGSLVSSQQPALQQRDGTMDPGEQMFAIGLMSLHLTLVRVALQTPVDVEPVRPHDTAGFDGIGDKPKDARFGQIGDATHTDAADSVPVFLGGNENQGFLFCPTADGAFFPASPVGFVDLDPSAQSVPTRADHRPSQFVEHSPGGFVAAQTQSPLQPQGADAMLLVCDVPHGPKPDGQGQVAVLENGARGDRGLVAAVPAKQPAPFHLPCLPAATVWANEALRPTEVDQILAAGFLIGEPMLQLHDCSRIILDHTMKHYGLWSVESRA